MIGQLSIVGCGPGDEGVLTPQGKKRLLQSNIIVGYKTYINLIKHLIPEEIEVLSYGMMEEVKRSQMAIYLAKKGNRVSIISGGDAGVFSIAGPVLELLSAKEQEDLQVEIIPGVTSALSSAALLGAPLIHDFSVISLSNLLTPTKLIEKRLKLAAQGDFVTVLYNPASKKRMELIKKSQLIFTEISGQNLIVGIVRKGFRQGQEVVLTDLEHMLDFEIDMNTTVIIGNSQTFIRGKFMITPRGYHIDRE